MGKIRTSDGRLVDPFDIQPEDIRPWVIIPALARINRFTGQSAWPYSVAQHTLNLYYAVPVYLRKMALVHDFSESWFNDLASPVKAACPDYKTAEKEAGRRIRVFYHLSEAEHDEFDQYDKRIYKDERNHLFPIINELGMGDQHEALGLGPEHFAEHPWRNITADLREVFIDTFGWEAYNHRRL